MSSSLVQRKVTWAETSPELSLTIQTAFLSGALSAFSIEKKGFEPQISQVTLRKILFIMSCFIKDKSQGHEETRGVRTEHRRWPRGPHVGAGHVVTTVPQGGCMVTVSHRRV